MSNRAKALMAVLVVALLAAASASFLLLDSNSRLNKDNAAATTRLQMSSILAEGQMAVDLEIGKIRDLAVDLAQQLRQTGLNGTAAREEMNSTLALCPYAVDVLTVDAGGNVLAVEPEQYRFMEGEVFDDNGTIELLTLKVPLMSSTFIAREGMRAATYACPVFDADGMFIGAVSILYDAAALMNATLPSLTVGTAFTWFSMQLNGLEVYDTDASQIGRNTLTDPLYANYTQLLDTARRSINETSGYGTYSFVVEAAAHQTVNKEVYWTTVGTDTVQWRLYLAHAV